jgi:sugar/nucleoside kinase (ribokinase family)
VRVELVTAGEAFEDLVFYDLPRLPRPGEELKTSRFARAPGGGAIITAVTAARLGVRTAVVSAVGEATQDRLRAERVALRNLRRAGEEPAVTAALSTGRERTFITFNGVNDRLEPRLLRELRRLSAPHVHCAFFPARCAEWTRVVRALQARGGAVSWDFGWNPALRRQQAFAALLAALDLVFVNEAEAKLYAGVRSLPAAFAWWRRTARAAVVKLGARGAVYLSDAAVLRSPAVRARVVDTTGAGDAFDGGYLSARLRGGDAGTCLLRGNEAGAAAVTRAGGL